MQNYAIYDEIGKGKHSTVYKGRKKKTIDYFAIKSIDKSQRQKVLNEVQILHALNAIHVLKFFNWYETNNHLWLIVELCTGSDLLSIIKQDKWLPEETMHSFAFDIVCGLAYIHSHGILYCDLKPSNVLVDGNSIVKLSDFGLAQYVEQVAVSQNGGKKVGTPCYMAPELFQEGGIHSYSSDLWSLGCMLYEMATGRPPFVDRNLEKLIHIILYEPFVPPPNVSADLQDLLKRLLQKDPMMRPDWEELCAHSWWKQKITPPALPVQPCWEQYMRQRATSDGQNKKESDEKSKKEVTRLSTNVKSNMLRESASDTYGTSRPVSDNNGNRSTPATTDSMNPDAEVDFGDHRNEENAEDEEGDEDSGSSPSRVATATSDASDVQSGDIISLPATDHVKKQQQQQTNGVQQGKGRQEQKSMEQLLWHLSDTYVKPIMMNNRIERVAEPKFSSEDVPFQCHPLQTFTKFPQQQQEQFLTQVYKSIGGHGKVIDKYHSLLYFQTLCQDQETANAFVNSPLMTLFVKMVQNSNHPPHLKVQLCMCMGILIRHATFIDPTLLNSGIVDAFVGLLQDNSTKDRKVKRRCTACLGELLFYIATQEHKAAWHVQPHMIQAIVDCLKGDDEITKHYATKTIENITGHSDPEYGLKFCKKDTVHALLNIFSSQSKNEHLKIASISAVGRLCKMHPACLQWTLDSMSPNIIGKLISSNQTNQRSIQSLLNVLNLYFGQLIAYYLTMTTVEDQPSFLFSHLQLLGIGQLAEADPTSQSGLFQHCYLGATEVGRIEKSIQLDHGLTLAQGLVTAFEQGTAVVRGKVLLSIVMLSFCGLHYLLQCCDNKLCMIMERQLNNHASGPDTTYMLSCLQLFLNLTRVVTSSTMCTLALDLEANANKAIPKLSIENISVVVHCLTTPCLRASSVSQTMIEWLARSLGAIEKVPFASQDETKRILFAIVEALSQDATLLKQYGQSIIQFLLVSLSDLLVSPNGDTRFLCLKMFIDILVHFITDKDFYLAGSSTTPFSQPIDQLVNQQLIPKCVNLLNDEDPIPLYGLKLMNNIASENAAVVEQFYQRDLIQKFFEFFELEHRNNNVHNVKLILKVVVASTRPSSSNSHKRMIPLSVVYSLGIISKLTAVLTYAFDKNVESFFEPCLDIAHTLLYDAHHNLAKKDNEDGKLQLQHNQPLSNCIPLYTVLCLNRDWSVAETAARDVLLCAQLYPECHTLIISPHTIRDIRQTLMFEGEAAVIPVALLKAIHCVLSKTAAVDPNYMAVISKEGLHAELHRISKGPYSEVSSLCSQILALMQL